MAIRSDSAWKALAEATRGKKGPAMAIAAKITITPTEKLLNTGLPSVTLSRLDYSEIGSRSSRGGRALTLMFFLTDTPVADFPVTLRISPTYPGFFPESVTIPAGSSSYRIWMVVPPVAGSLYTLTATDPYGVTQTLTMYLTQLKASPEASHLFRRIKD